MVAGPGVEPGTKAYETFMIPFQYPAALLIFGSGGENRTPIMGFGDPYTAIVLHRNGTGTPGGSRTLTQGLSSLIRYKRTRSTESCRSETKTRHRAAFYMIKNLDLVFRLFRNMERHVGSDRPLSPTTSM